MAWIDTYQKWLSESESLHNAQIIVNHFIVANWTKEAICAMLGNMRHESSVNPNMSEYGYNWDDDRGYGLVQWTPRSKYWNWAISSELDPANHETQLSRIDYESMNNVQWIANGHKVRYGLEDMYELSFAEFRFNIYGYTVGSMTEAFMWNYEGPSYEAGINSLASRQAFAIKCFNQLDFSAGVTPPPPVGNGTTANALIHMLLSDTIKGWK